MGHYENDGINDDDENSGEHTKCQRGEKDMVSFERKFSVEKVILVTYEQVKTLYESGCYRRYKIDRVIL
jgi:hypothetical protein